jgi:hypothetical protein
MSGPASAPIQHVVVFRWEQAAHPDVGGLARELTAFAATLNGIISYGCGPDLGVRAVNDDFAVAAVFAVFAGADGLPR